MVFCSRCGEVLPENAYFCLKCGVMTNKGVEVNVSYPWNWEKEVEKTLATVTKEVGNAFKTVKESILKPTKKELVTCSQCGGKNEYGSKFCYKCGKVLN